MTHPSLKNLTGQIFGRLTVITQAGNRPRGGAMWLCKCSCGNETTVYGNKLRRGLIVSCGCHKKTIKETHGQSRTKLYKVWTGMRQRCANPNTKFFQHYGGRGISVCDDWMDFIKFREWADESGYAEGLTIERIDVNGGYSPDNCKWVPPYEQFFNRRKTLKRGDGTPWFIVARESGLPENMFKHRVDSGWPADIAATAPKYTRLKSALKGKE